MKLWLIAQDKNNDYDTYDSAVVAAETAEEARNINPDGRWNDTWSSWCADPLDVTVTMIGEAAPGVEPGIVLASFNAG